MHLHIHKIDYKYFELREDLPECLPSKGLLTNTKVETYSSLSDLNSGTIPFWNSLNWFLTGILEAILFNLKENYF